MPNQLDGLLPDVDGTITREAFYRGREGTPPKSKPIPIIQRATPDFIPVPTTGGSSSPTGSPPSKPAVSPAATSPRRGSSSTKTRSHSSRPRRVSRAARPTDPEMRAGLALLNLTPPKEPNDALESLKGVTPRCEACDEPRPPAEWVYRVTTTGRDLTLCGDHAAIAVKGLGTGTLLPGEAVWGKVA